MRRAATKIKRQPRCRRQWGKGGHRKNKLRRRGGGVRVGALFKATRGKGKKEKDGRFKRMHEITTRGWEVRGWRAGERARGMKGGSARRQGWGEARIRERRAVSKANKPRHHEIHSLTSQLTLPPNQSLASVITSSSPSSSFFFFLQKSVTI